MSEPYVRPLTEDELPAAVRVVSQGMLGSLADDVLDAWRAVWRPEECHGAFTADGHLVGVVRWFRDEVSVPGTSVPAGGVTAVAVASTHRRQGHLTRLMDAQLAHMADAGVAIATLVAAEWPIYGRFGYGPAMDACGYEVDSRSARFVAPPEGSIDLVSPAELQPHLAAMHDARWARTPGSLRRLSPFWAARAAGVERWPNDTQDAGMLRGAVWRDPAGEVQGAVSYIVTDTWVRNRPAGKAEVRLLVGATPQAERELWRHLCEIDWVSTVSAGLRSVDDPLPLMLTDGRAAAPVERSDAIWARVLDVPAAFAARRSPTPGRVVVDIQDERGYGAGRWALELGPDEGSATRTDEAVEVALPVGALGATYFGGHSPRRLADAGAITELVDGGVDRLSALLATPTMPWSTTSY